MRYINPRFTYLLTYLKGPLNGYVCVCILWSRRSIETAGRIELVFVMEASFSGMYTLSYKKVGDIAKTTVLLSWTL